MEDGFRIDRACNVNVPPIEVHSGRASLILHVHGLLEWLEIYGLPIAGVWGARHMDT